MESSISRKPNLSPAVTGINPVTGEYLSTKERITIFRKRRIDVGKVFGRRTDLSKYGAIVKAPKPMSLENRVADIESMVMTIGDKFKKLQDFVINNELLNRKFAIKDEQLKLKQDERLAFEKQEEENENEKKLNKTLSVPMTRVAKKAQGFLSSLMKAFGFLFGGWLTDKAFKFLDDEKSGDKDKISEIKEKVISSTAQVLGVFLFMNAFIAKLPAIIAGVATSVASLGVLIGKFLLNPAGLKALAALGLGYLGAKYVIEPGVKSIANKLAGGVNADEDTQAAFRQAFANEEQKLIAAGVQPPSNVNSRNAMLIDVAGQESNMGIDQNTGQFGELYLKSINPETNKPYATPEQEAAFEEYKKNVKNIRKIEADMRPTLKSRDSTELDKRDAQVEAMDQLGSQGFLEEKQINNENIEKMNIKDDTSAFTTLDEFVNYSYDKLSTPPKGTTNIINIDGGQNSGGNTSYNQESSTTGIANVNPVNTDDIARTETGLALNTGS